MPCEDFLYEGLQGRAPRAGPRPAYDLGWRRASVALTADGAAPVRTSWPSFGGALRGGRRLPSFDPSGHVGAAARASPWPSVRTSRREDQRRRACCKRRPSLRRPILKPRKIAVKGALRASLRDPFGPPDRESWRGFIGAYRSDGGVRAWLSPITPPPAPKMVIGTVDSPITFHPVPCSTR
jgi:hypothetical protein